MNCSEGGKTHTSAGSPLDWALRPPDLPPMECGAGASRVSCSPACLGDGLSCGLATDGAGELSTSAPWSRSAGFEPTRGVGSCSCLSTDPWGDSRPDVALLLPTLSERPWTTSSLSGPSNTSAVFLNPVASCVETLCFSDWALVPGGKDELLEYTRHGS